jgi:hypothetical protein
LLNFQSVGPCNLWSMIFWRNFWRLFFRGEASFDILQRKRTPAFSRMTFIDIFIHTTDEAMKAISSPYLITVRNTNFASRLWHSTLPSNGPKFAVTYSLYFFYYHHWFLGYVWSFVLFIYILKLLYILLLNKIQT